MPRIKVVNMAGEEVGKLNLSATVFGCEVNAPVLHSAVRAYLNNQRQGTQSTLTRSEVSGGGKKPWRQKGTGRARQGSTRSPQWTHGGVALGPKPRLYKVKLNKKVKRLAMLSALSSKVEAKEMIVIDQIVAAEQKADEKAKVKFTGGQYVHVEAQTVSGSLLGVSVSSDVKEGWYYKITYTVTSGEGKTTDCTAYFYFEKGADNATTDLLGAGFSSWKNSVEGKSAKGKVGSL